MHATNNPPCQQERHCHRHHNYAKARFGTEAFKWESQWTIDIATTELGEPCASDNNTSPRVSINAIEHEGLATRMRLARYRGIDAEAQHEHKAVLEEFD